MACELVVERLKNWNVVIKIGILGLSVLAFVCTLSYASCIYIRITCPVATDATEGPDLLDKGCFSYPFKTTEIIFAEKCNQVLEPGEVIATQSLFHDNYSSPAIFYVFVGVCSLIYFFCITCVLLLWNTLYTTNYIAPIVDLAATSVLLLFWFCGCTAWAVGVTKLKGDMEAASLAANVESLNAQCSAATCKVLVPQDFSLLNFSLFCGFANVCLIFMSIFFVWRETKWYKGTNATGLVSGGPIPGGTTAGYDNSYNNSDYPNLPRTTTHNRGDAFPPNTDDRAGGYVPF